MEECPHEAFNCDGICYACSQFVGEARYEKFWEDEESMEDIT